MTERLVGELGTTQDIFGQDGRGPGQLPDVSEIVSGEWIEWWNKTFCNANKFGVIDPRTLPPADLTEILALRKIYSERHFEPFNKGSLYAFLTEKMGERFKEIAADSVTPFPSLVS